MSPRPKNPPPDRRQEILAAALRVFAEKGFAAATNADIARAAGVTPAALYYYYPSKADLLQAAVTQRRGFLQANLADLLDRLKQVPPDVVLPMMAQNMLQFLSDPDTQALLRIVLSEGPRNPEIATIWATHAVGPMMPFVFGYIQHQMDQERLRRIDPKIAGVMLVGPILMLTIVRDVLGLELAKDIDPQEFTRTVAETILAGLTLPHKE
jgi:AcrR family transcriptional regulator